MVLSGLRGVGKTVLLNALRGQAVKRAWGTGKIEARPDQSLRLPLAQAVHAAVREVGHRHRDPDRVDAVAGVLKSFALRTPLPDRKGVRWQPPVDVPATKGRADSGDLELDLIELFTDVADLARDLGVGIAALRRRDAGHRHRRARRAVRRLPRDQPAGRAAARGRRRPAAPAGRAGGQQVLRRAALPLRRRRPAAARDGRPGAARAGRHRGRRLRRRTRSTSSTRSPTATPTSCRPTARSPGTSRRGQPDPGRRRAEAAPEAEAELAVGFFGARYDRATPAERDYMRAMADLGAAPRRRPGRPPRRRQARWAASRRRCPRPATG